MLAFVLDILFFKSVANNFLFYSFIKGLIVVALMAKAQLYQIKQFWYKWIIFWLLIDTLLVLWPNILVSPFPVGNIPTTNLLIASIYRDIHRPLTVSGKTLPVRHLAHFRICVFEILLMSCGNLDYFLFCETYLNTPHHFSCMKTLQVFSSWRSRIPQSIDWLRNKCWWPL